MLQATGKWIAGRIVSSRPGRVLSGLAAGTAWTAVSAVWCSAYEPLWAARAAFAVAVILALTLLSIRPLASLLGRIPLFWRIALASCGWAAWPALWKLAASWRTEFSLEWFTQDSWACLATTLISMATIFPAVVLGLLPAIQFNDSSGAEPVVGGGRFWSGVALAFAIAPTTVFTRITADRALLLVAASLLLGAGFSLLFREESEATEETKGESHNLGRSSTSQSWQMTVMALITACGLACTLEIGLRVGEQLVIDSLPLRLFGWSGFLLGLCLAQLGQGHDRQRTLRGALVVLSIAAAGLGLAYPWGMEAAIQSSAVVSKFAGIVIAKGTILACILAPVGFVAGRLGRIASPSMVFVSTGAAWLLSSRLQLPWGEALLAVTIGSWIGLITFWSRESWSSWWKVRGWQWRTAELALGGLLLLTAWWGSHRLDPARSSQLVFNADSYAAMAQGHELATIERADRSRLVKIVSGTDNLWTVWRQRGCQLLTRRNGIAVSLMTTDTGVCPQNMWPVLGSVVPLVVHPRPDHVLCVNPQGMAELDSLLSFPIQSLTCLTAEPAQREILRTQAEHSGTESRLQDGRVEWLNVAPSHYAAARSEQLFDVILVPDGVLAPAFNQPQLTSEFHVAMASRLQEGGLYCQRLSVLDFGSETLSSLLRSLESAFGQVAIVTTDGNELIVLASRSPAPLIDASLIERLETPHVRRLFAQMGADWSMLTQLTWIAPEHVHEMADQAAMTNRVLTGQFALRLASDALRWSAKWKEKQELYADRATLVLKAMQLKEDAEQVIARRILDSQARIKILTSTPDNQWSYRRELKESLKNRPRTTIQKVNNEIRQTFDEYDQRRKDYFLVLGAAARQEHPTAQSISALEKFAEPYDPLLTEFAHFEAAHLLARSESPDRIREYRNWMFCVGYAPSNDRSVAPVIAAMDLLRRHPEIEPDAGRRWEQHGALMDAMRLRWINRWREESKSKYEAADMHYSAIAITSTLSAMDDLAAPAGIDRETWQVQRQVWEDTLLSPLRAKQTEVNPEDRMLETVRQQWQNRETDQKAVSEP